MEVDEPVHLAGYDPAWPQAFESERRRLSAALGITIDAIAHIGSTAVPGVVCKPIVDIMIGVAPFPPPEPWSRALTGAGYEALGDAGVRGRLYFRRRVGGDFNVHVVERDGEIWCRNLLLRQHLRRSAEAGARYASAKETAIASGATRLLAYSAAKAAAVEELLRRAAEAVSITTPRLTLRRWRTTDREPFARMNADPRVMRYFPAPLTRNQSDALADTIAAHVDIHGWGGWAVEVHDVSAFAGFIGLSRPRFTAPFTPCVEIGWRLSADVWGRGYATEGARAAMEFGFDTLGLREIVSFTTESNVPSRRVMERIGMTYDPRDDFDHPSLRAGHALRRHVLYRIRRP